MTTAGGLLLERDPQLAALASYWSDACAGNGRLVFLGGEAGSGKTALSLEFGRRIASRARFLVGTRDAGSTPRPLGPLLDVADNA